jgi:hypothetical protein
MKLAGAYINEEKYARLVALAASNNRTLAGQCRHLFDRALSGELKVPSRAVRTERETLAARREGLMAAPPCAGSADADANGAAHASVLTLAEDELRVSLSAPQEPGLPRKRSRALRPMPKRQGHGVPAVAGAAQKIGAATAVKEGAL